MTDLLPAGERESEAEKYENRIASTRVIILIVSLVCIVAYFIWAVFALLNTSHYGQIYDYRYTSVGWWLLLAMSLNGVVYFCAIAMIAEPKSVGRADVHSVVSVIMLFANLLILLVLLGYFLPAARNTFWSYREPFNDPHYCCVFKDEPNVKDSQCWNLLTCPNAIRKRDLTTSGIFTLHWIFAIIFLFLAAANLGTNYLARSSGLVHNSPGPRREARIFALFFLFLCAALFVYWAAVPLANTQHTHGYPRFAIPPSPGPFASTRHWAQWWMLWLMSLFVLPIVLFAASMTENDQSWLTTIFFWVTIFVTIGCFIATVILLGYGLFYCNNFFGFNLYNTPGSICNDDRWCGPYFANNIDWCPNVTPFIPDVKGSDLRWNPMFTQNFIFSIVFWVLGIVFIFLYYRLVRFGILYTSRIEE